MKNHRLIFPISLDLGAKTTGVYATCYPASSHIDPLSECGHFKIGFVANTPDIKEKGYKILQTSRTTNRHARRCRTRNTQAKKLLLLILETVYQFPATKHREAISHFMNRRGFTYLESQINSDELDAIESECIAELTYMFNEAGLDEISALFSEQPLSDALNAVIYHHSEQLPRMLDLVNEQQANSKLAKKQLKPLAQALALYHKDLTSGAKHRRKYFNRIKNDVYLLAQHPVKGCRKLLYKLQDHGKRQKKDMVAHFYQLVCHINNFDLKLLNRILRDIDNKTTNADIEKIISRHFGRWVLKQWAMSPANGQVRLQEIRELQRTWRKHEQNGTETVFDFFLTTPPEQTIPPYESHTNRRPPRCQTLILNPQELNARYPDWKQWLNEIQQITPDVVKRYTSALEEVESGAGNPLIQGDERLSRVLQFMLDRSKNSDPLLLNEQWSIIKKCNQLKRQGQSINEHLALLSSAMTKSTLPTRLKPPQDLRIENGSFWHLVNRYFQSRRKARDGRYFLHYDRTVPESSRWQSHGKLLKVCIHRPRQLSHQAINDVCSLLGVTTEQLQTDDLDTLQVKLKSVRGLKTTCEKAYRAQKRHGMDLPQLLHVDKDLVELNTKIPELMASLAECLSLQLDRKKAFIERNQSLYTLVQLYPLVWGERSGFGKTCPVCAKDNSVRMTNTRGIAQASRLSTLSMRIIDGALKRLLTHQAHHIVNRLWPEITRQADQVSKITLPLILEQNRFDFTENLPLLKGLPKPKAQGATLDLAGQKQQRIRLESQGICPYSGVEISDNSGDIDHIIPRSGAYGTLNDEANLIYADSVANRQIKRNRALTLSDLDKGYLFKQFGTHDITNITEYIEKQLWDENKQGFTFGAYRQFIALDSATQIAFRHALFLPADHPLRAQVISAIVHRNKSRVNGTQRYMAQLLADVLIQKSRGTPLEGKLEFDFFQVSSRGSDENSTVALRKALSSSTLSPGLDIRAFDKQKGKTQHPHSHVIDATMAFMLALDQHQGEGALKLNLDPAHPIWGEVNDDGVLTARLFEQLAIADEQRSAEVLVTPRSSYQSAALLSRGAKPHQAISRPIFKQNALGLEFYSFNEQNGKPYKGFVQYTGTQGEFVKGHQKPADANMTMLNFALEQRYYREQKHGAVRVFHPNTQKLTALLFDVLERAKYPEFDKQAPDSRLALWLFGKSGGAGQLFYYSKNTGLENAPNVIAKETSSPYYVQWKRHYDEWLKIAPDTKVDKRCWVIPVDQLTQWQKHCQKVLEIESSPRQHKAVKRYSMKAMGNGSGVMGLIKRHAPYGVVYQLQSFDNSALTPDEIPLLALQSPNVVLFKKERITKGYSTTLVKKAVFRPQAIPAQAFFNLEQCEQLGLSIDQIQIHAIKATRVEVYNIPTDWIDTMLILQGHDQGKRWREQKSIAISNSPLADDAMQQSTLQSLLSRGCHSDKNIGVSIDGALTTLAIPYKSNSLVKLLEE